MEGATERGVVKKLQVASNQSVFLWRIFATWGREKKG